MARPTGDVGDTYLSQIQEDFGVSWVDEKTFKQNCLLVHKHLESKREAADLSENVGPVVLVVGGGGKGTFARLLVDHAGSSGRTPVFVDLGVSRGFFSQIMGLSIAKRNAEDNSISSLRETKFFFYGSNNPGADGRLHSSLMEQCSEAMSCKLSGDKLTRSSGAIIHTCGWPTRCGYRYILTMQETMKATVVIVIGFKELHEQLVEHNSTRIQTLYVPEVDGSVIVKHSAICALQSQVRDYFHQPSVQNKRGMPYSFRMPFSDLNIYKSEVGISSRLTQVSRAYELTKLQLLVAFAGPLSEEKTLASREVEEIMCILDIDVKTSTLTLLSRRPPLFCRKLLFIATKLRLMNATATQAGDRGSSTCDCTEKVLTS